MSVVPPPDPIRPEPGAPPEDRDMEVFARVEGLLGQEHALLRIPASERTEAQHRRLREITDELDRIVDRLRDRAAQQPA